VFTIQMPQDSTPEQVSARVAEVQQRVHGAIAASVAAQQGDDADTRIVRLLVQARAANQHPSYDGRVQLLNETIAGFMALLTDLYPAKKDLWPKLFDSALQAIHVVYAQIEKEQRSDSAVH
jgi:hypothetical protein